MRPGDRCVKRPPLFTDETGQKAPGAALKSEQQYNTKSRDASGDGRAAYVMVQRNDTKPEILAPGTGQPNPIR